MTEFTFLYRKGCPFCEAAEEEWVKAERKLEEMRIVPSPMKIQKENLETMKKRHGIQTFPAFLLKRRGEEEGIVLIPQENRTEKTFLLFALS
jgi:glutaredoxin